ncbi:hypothetical protein BZA77DRAFT_151837 [Pyronema omphalodes]|nr:hypothetical protein BZA77DRAFT_151837 [Pyronema omphalodes]
MPGAGRPLPNFPCLCKAIYSWTAQTKRDLGLSEGDLIECLNAGDGQWWMGRLRRNRQMVGLFPSNYVEVLDGYPVSGGRSRPQSRADRAESPMMYGDGRRAVSPTPSNRSRGASPRAHSPQPPQHRSRSPQPPMHNQSYEGGSSRSRLSRAESPNPYGGGYNHGSMSRAASPNPYRAVSPNPYGAPNTYNRSASPNPYARATSPAPRAVSPAPSHYRATSPAPSQFRSVSPAPSQRHYQRAASPNPYQRAASPNPYHDDDGPPPAPPPHRIPPRSTSPMPPAHGGRLTPTPSGSRAPTPNGQTPSPLRSAMEDVMESLQHMGGGPDHDDLGRSHTPSTPWGPESFGDLYTRSPSPRKRIIRPETSLGIAGRHEYDDEEEDLSGMPVYSDDNFNAAPMTMEDRLRRFQQAAGRGDDDMAPPVPIKYASYSDRPKTTTDAAIPNRMSMYDFRAVSASPSKMTRPRPLSRMETLSSNTTSNHSSSTTATHSTGVTSASIMSGASAGAFSATSAGSLARRKHMSMIEAAQLGSYAGRPETPSGSMPLSQLNGPGSVGPGSYAGSAGSVSGFSGRKRGQTWGASTAGSPNSNTGVFGGLAPPKPKKESFFKKILNSAKTSAASVRSVAESNGLSSFGGKSLPDGVIGVGGGGRDSPVHGGDDWITVRRDVNRSNTLSRNERIERQEKQQMLDQPVLRPVDALEEDVDGDEAADGGIVERPQNFDTANLSLVDKGARFISSLPPFTTPESLATHHVCRPYRTDVQKLRAIFTWISEKIAWEHPSDPVEGEYGPEPVDTRRVLSNKRGSPEEVAFVVQGMCHAVGIHCDIIHGYLKLPGEVIDISAIPRPNHWWNAVVVDGEWRFMDCSLSSPTHPRRLMYSASPTNQAEFFYFLTRPREFCWTHVPLIMEQQHMLPPVPLPVLLSLPTACPGYFRQGMKLRGFDTSLTRIEDLEVVQIEIEVPVGIECVAEVETNGFSIDHEGEVYETGDTMKKRALSQVYWESGRKMYRIKAVLPGDEGEGVLKVYAGKRGLMQSISTNPHPLCIAFPIIHEGNNAPYEFLIRHPTPHAQRHDLYVSQPQCARLAINNTFVFAVRQSPGDGSSTQPVEKNGVMPYKPAKLGIQTPSGRILRLMQKKPGKDGDIGDGDAWETIIKCGERGAWRALVLADRTARWCVYAEWQVL